MSNYYKRLKALINLYFKSAKMDKKTLESNLKVFLNYTVHSGPFKSMEYIGTSSGSAYYPKLTGTYECELHPTLQEIIDKKYEYLIDVGAAEGYYAVGFAFLNKKNAKFKVLAFDIDDVARKNLLNLAKLNHVEHLIEIEKEFNLECLNRFTTEKVLIICDIEGAEKDLLDPVINRKLLNCDVLVEIHDGIETNTIKDLLKSRFSSTHEISNIKYERNHEIRRSYLNWIGNRKEMDSLAEEWRQYGLDWYYLVKKGN